MSLWDGVVRSRAPGVLLGLALTRAWVARFTGALCERHPRRKAFWRTRPCSSTVARPEPLATQGSPGPVVSELR